MQQKIDSGYFLPDVAKIPMKRVKLMSGLISGRSTTPPYIVVYKEASGRTNHIAWRSKAQYGTKGDGKPTEANLKKWVEGLNQSIDGGTNSHLPQSAKVVEAVIKRNESGAYTTIQGPSLVHFKVGLKSSCSFCPHCGQGTK